MSKDVEHEQHERYLKDSENCWKVFDQTTARRGKKDRILKLPKRDWPSNLEDWWDNSYDIIDDWNKEIVPIVEEWEKRNN